MHPLIKKFWEKQGKEIRTDKTDNYCVWYLCSDLGYYDHLSFVVPLVDDIVCIKSQIGGFALAPKYYWLGKTLSEQEMLRLINLKSFL